MSDNSNIRSGDLANSILDNLDALVLVAGSDGQIEYCSESILRLLKVRRSDVLGMGWWNLTRSDSSAREKEIAEVKKIIAGITPINKVPYTKSIANADGDIYWIQWQDALGPGGTLIGVGQNITEHYNAQVLIEEQRRQLKMLSLVAEKTDNVVLILDPEGNVEWVSPSFERLNNMTMEELIGRKGSRNILHISNNPGIADILHEVTTRKVPLTYESQNKNITKVVWELSTISPVLNENGEVSNIIIIDTDVTERKLAEEIIRSRNKDITDSIQYAKRIQQAKLTPLADIAAAIPQSFVIFKPKDIVSGDFYYFTSTAEHVFIGAGDCTGHGVSGALMSMIALEKLEEAVSSTSDLSEVLNLVNRKIRSALKQDGNSGSTRDGMDIALCRIPHKGGPVHFAGANRPLWIVRKNGKDLEEIKGTKKAIGGLTDNLQHFDTHTLHAGPGDTIYLFTDGYADTFGGRSQKKLTSKKFRELVLSIRDRSMHDQQEYLDHFIEEWRGDTEQVDDILVIGIRL